MDETDRDSIFDIDRAKWNQLAIMQMTAAPFIKREIERINRKIDADILAAIDSGIITLGADITVAGVKERLMADSDRDTGGRFDDPRGKPEDLDIRLMPETDRDLRGRFIRNQMVKAPPRSGSGSWFLPVLLVAIIVVALAGWWLGGP